jgi:hypothetical protein
MVENLAESPGISSDGLGSARIEIPKEGAFSLREGKKEREEGPSFSLGTRREAANLSPSRLGSHRHAAGADSPRRPRVQSARSVDGPDPRRGRSVKTNRTSRDAPGPHQPRGRPRWPGGQSTRTSRTVRSTTGDDPTSPFIFDLI